MILRRLFVTAVCALALQGAMAMEVDGVTGATEQVNEMETTAQGTPAQQLKERLKTLKTKGIMLGHQDDPVYGTTWKWDEGKSDVLLTCGDYPAVMGFDLGKLELDSPDNIDGVPFDRMRQEIVAQYERGGVVTLSWHPWNPVNGENAWNFEGECVKKVLGADKDVKKKFDSWLEKVAEYIKTLKTADGKLVPVIFRPWHEMNGGWFWWGANVCTPAEYNLLYTKTYSALTAAGCNNIVWAWSPNLGSEKTVEKFLERYPGDSFVDLIGVDVYEFDNDDAAYQKNLTATLDVMMAAAKKTGKMATLSETGCRGISQKTDWFTKTIWPVIQKYDLSYVLFWRNAWDNPATEAYLPGVGDGAIVKDFKKFAAQKKVLTAKKANKVK